METIQQNYSNMMIAEVELVYRTRIKPSERPKINSTASAYEILLKVWDVRKIEHTEQAKVLLLNRANRLLGVYELSTGGISETIVDSRLLFSAALLANATGIILAHNHPSGNLEPSTADRRLTEKLRKAGELLDITVFDHIIISSEGYYSFADEGLLA